MCVCVCGRVCLCSPVFEICWVSSFRPRSPVFEMRWVSSCRPRSSVFEIRWVWSNRPRSPVLEIRWVSSCRPRSPVLEISWVPSYTPRSPVLEIRCVSSSRLTVQDLQRLKSAGWISSYRRSTAVSLEWIDVKFKYANRTPKHDFHFDDNGKRLL